MPQNCKTQGFFVKSNIYTLLESQKVQLLENFCLQFFFRAGCHGNGPNFFQKIFFPKIAVLCHWKDNFMLNNICNRT